MAASKFYVGVSNKARAVKTLYVGVADKARRVKKLYVGDSNNKARLIFYDIISATPSAMANAANYPAGGSTTSYGLAMGGRNTIASGTSGQLAVTTAYNSSLTKTTSPSIGFVSYQCMGGSVGAYAICAGGINGTAISTQFNAINNSLTRANPVTLPIGVYAGSITTNFERSAMCIFGGISSSGVCDQVLLYNSSLTAVYGSSLSPARCWSGAAATTDKFICVGGNTSATGNDGSKYIEAFDASLVKTTQNFPVTRCKVMGNSLGKEAIFAGGRDSSAVRAAVYVIDNGLAISSVADLPAAKLGVASSTVTSKKCAVFILNTTNQTVIYDMSRTQSLGPTFTAGRYNHCVATVGDYVLSIGGQTSSSALSSVDALQI